MTLVTNINLAIRGLRASKKRAFMTMLGIIIGVGAVIVIMSVGAGAQSLLINELSGFGSNLIGVTPGAANEDGPPASVMGITVTTLTLDDADDIRKIPYITSLTAMVRGVGTINYGGQKVEVNFVGACEELPEVEAARVEHGRFYSVDEDKALARVAVLGYQVKQDLFGDGDAIGENIKIKKQNFRVIGVMEERGTVAFENKDNLVYVPVRTAQKILLGISHISLLRAKVNKTENIDLAIAETKQILRENHNIDDPKNDDFSARSLGQALDALTTVTDGLRFFLAGIAAISLLVGGIGIMNIMFVNIAERTKEIGLRKAVGATRENILKQFLIESATMTLIGGIIGIIGGVLLSWGISAVAQAMEYKWDFVVTIPSILLGLGVSAAVGLIFGSYPAGKAAKMEVVEALRAE